jgi:hypothetical protein
LKREGEGRRGSTEESVRASLCVSKRECDEARHEEEGREVLGEAALLAEAEVLHEDHGEQLAALEHHLRRDIEVFQAHVGQRERGDLRTSGPSE